MSDKENDDTNILQNADVEFYIIEIDLTGGKPWGFEYKQEDAKDEADEKVKVLRVTQVDPSGKCRRALQQDDLIESIQGRSATEWSIDEVDTLLSDGELKELKLEVKRSPDKFDPNQPLEGSDTIQEITSSITAGGDFIEEVGFGKEEEEDNPTIQKTEEQQKTEERKLSVVPTVLEEQVVPAPPVEEDDVVMKTAAVDERELPSAPIPHEKRQHDEVAPSEEKTDEQEDATRHQRLKKDDDDNDDQKPTERKHSVVDAPKLDGSKQPEEPQNEKRVPEIHPETRETEQKSPDTEDFSSEPLTRYGADDKADAKTTPLIEEPRDDTDVSTPASMDNGQTFDDLVVNNISPVASQVQLNELNENSTATNLLDVGGLSTIEEEKSGAVGNTTYNNNNNNTNSAFNSRRESSSTLFDVPHAMPEYERKLSQTADAALAQQAASTRFTPNSTPVRQDSGENLLSVPERKSSVNLPQQLESRSGSSAGAQPHNIQTDEEKYQLVAENDATPKDGPQNENAMEEAAVQPSVATVQDDETDHKVPSTPSPSQPSQSFQQQQPQQQTVDKPWQKRFHTDEGRNEARNRLKERQQAFQPQPNPPINRQTPDSPPAVNKKPASTPWSMQQQQQSAPVPVKPFLTPYEPSQAPTAAAAPPAVPPKPQPTQTVLPPLPPGHEEPLKPATMPSPPSFAYNSSPLQPSQSGGPAVPASISPPPKPKFNALAAAGMGQQPFNQTSAVLPVMTQPPLQQQPVLPRPVLPNLSITTPTGASEDNGLILSPTKKIYSTSSYYDEGQEQFPTMIEQIKQCRDIASSLTADPNQTSKGAAMFAKRLKKADKWTYGSDASVHESDAAWCTSDEDAAGGRLQKQHSTSLVNGHNKPQSTINGGVNGGADIPLHYYLSPKRVHDGGQIMRDEPTMRMFDETLPEARSVAQVFDNPTGRGGEMYLNRQKRADEWTIDESNVKQPPPPPPMKMTRSYTSTTTTKTSSSGGPGGSTLDSLISHVKLIKSPWEAALESPSGSCDAAFQNVQGAGQFNSGPAALSSLSTAKSNLSMNQPAQPPPQFTADLPAAEPLLQHVRQRSGSFPQQPTSFQPDVLPYSQPPTQQQQTFSSSETTRTTVTHHQSSSQQQKLSPAFASFASNSSGQPQTLSPIPSVGTLTPSPTPVAASAYSHKTPMAGGQRNGASPLPPPRTPVNTVYQHTIFGQQQQLYPPTPSPTPHQQVQGAAFARYQTPPATHDVAQRAQQYVAHNQQQQQQQQQQQAKFWPPPQQGPPRRNSLLWNPLKNATGVNEKWSAHSTDEHKRDFASKLRAWSSSRVPDSNSMRRMLVKNNVSYQWNQQQQPQQQQRQYGSTPPMTRPSPNEMKQYPNNSHLPVAADQYAFIDKPRQQQQQQQVQPQPQQRASRYEQFTAQRAYNNPQPQQQQHVQIPIQRQQNFQPQQQPQQAQYRRASLQYNNTNNFSSPVMSPVPSTTTSSSRARMNSNQQRVFSPQPPPLIHQRQFSGGHQPLARQTSGSISYHNLSTAPYGNSVVAPVKVDVIRPANFVGGPPAFAQPQQVRQQPQTVHWAQPQQQPQRNAFVQQQQQQPRWNNAPPPQQPRYQAQPQPQYQSRSQPQPQRQQQQWQSVQNISSPHNAFNAPQKQHQTPQAQSRPSRQEQSTYYGEGGNAYNGSGGQYARGRVASPSSAASSMWTSNWELGGNNRTAGFASDF